MPPVDVSMLPQSGAECEPCPSRGLDGQACASYDVRMGAQHLQCTCGQLVFVPEEKAAGGIRCPACGVTVRTRQEGPTQRDETRANRRGQWAEGREDSPSSVPEADDGGAYEIAPEPGREPAGKTGDASSQRGTFYRSAGKSVPGGSPTSRPTGTRTFADKVLLEERERRRPTVELPGRFFKFSALFYPWLHPNWIRWLGLTFMTWLAVCMVAGSLFVLRIILEYGAFVSLFTVPTMAVGCLALVGFVFASFITVVEETAQGEDRLQRLAELNWWETLPRLMRTLGAFAVTTLATFGLTYPLRRWLVPGSIEMQLIQSLVEQQLFAIFLITNLVDNSWIPFTSLWATLKRLAACVDCFAVFLLLTVPPTIGLHVLLARLDDWHVWAAIAAAGPLGAAWFMFYGHWLGRLVRQLSAVD